MDKQEFLAAHMTEFKNIQRQSLSNEALEEMIKTPVDDSKVKPGFMAPDIEGFTFQNIDMHNHFEMYNPKFIHCKFINGSFFSGWVPGASLENCLMQSFNFTCIYFVQSNEFKNCVFYDCDFVCTMDGLFIENCCFIECNFQNVSIFQSYLKNITFVKCVGLDSIVYNNTINEHIVSI